jgi:hypothetical protein
VAHAIGANILHALGIKPTKPKKALGLSDAFHLPPERPRTLLRIPQVVHYPPVIERLFLDRYDDRVGTLTKPEFTFADVKRAIAETGVSLTWVRGETFLTEISRSRNVHRLLEPCLQFGYTIRRLGTGLAIGQFVPLGHPEGLEVKLAPKRDSRTKGAIRAEKTLF